MGKKFKYWTNTERIFVKNAFDEYCKQCYSLEDHTNCNLFRGECSTDNTCYNTVCQFVEHNYYLDNLFYDKEYLLGIIHNIFNTVQIPTYSQPCGNYNQSDVKLGNVIKELYLDKH